MLTANVKGKKHLRDLVIDGRIILEWPLMEQDAYMHAGLIWRAFVIQLFIPYKICNSFAS
jgi:hypothetical protein